MAIFSWPPSSASSAASAIQFNRNGSATTVAIDTGTPANSRPLPVQQLDTSGNAMTGASETTLSALNTKVTTTANGVKVDGSGVTQPISAVALPLPTGAASLAKQPAFGTAGVASVDVITVQGIASGVAQPISATSLPLPTGAATLAKQPALGTAGAAAADVITVQGIASMTALKVDASATIQPVSQSGTWTVQPGNTANTTAWLIKPETSATSTVTSIAGSATSVSILASNVSRKGAMFFNESTATLYLKLGTTASVTSYTVQLTPNAYFELPTRSIYTGAIDGIWSAANGNVRITELT